MYVINPLLLLILPLIFQIIFGIKSIGDRLQLNFSKVCFISILSQFICSYLTYQIVSHNLKINSNGQIHCGMPLMALIVLEIFLIIILLVITLIQFLIKRYYKHDTK